MSYYAAGDQLWKNVKRCGRAGKSVAQGSTRTLDTRDHTVAHTASDLSSAHDYVDTVNRAQYVSEIEIRS